MLVSGLPVFDVDLATVPDVRKIAVTRLKMRGSWVLLIGWDFEHGVVPILRRGVAMLHPLGVLANMLSCRTFSLQRPTRCAHQDLVTSEVAVGSLVDS